MISHRQHDNGFTLIELVMVVVVLGILAGVVAFGMGSVANGTKDGPCEIDRRTLVGATAIYLSKHGGTTIPPANPSPDGYEQTLVDADLLESTSVFHRLDATGLITIETGSQC